jgi:hypothetical protein
MIWIVGIGMFLFLLFMFPRQTGITIGLLVGIAAAIAGYFYLQDQADRRNRALVTVNAAYGRTLCTDPNFPLSLVIHNGSKVALDKLSIDVTANRVGYSDDVFFEYFSSDKIMQPNEYYSACWSLDDYKMKALQFSPLTLNWKAKASIVYWHEK